MQFLFWKNKRVSVIWIRFNWLDYITILKSIPFLLFSLIFIRFDKFIQFTICQQSYRLEEDHGQRLLEKFGKYAGFVSRLVAQHFTYSFFFTFWALLVRWTRLTRLTRCWTLVLKKVLFLWLLWSSLLGRVFILSLLFCFWIALFYFELSF